MSDLAWSRLGVEPAELSEIAVECEVYWVLQRHEATKKLFCILVLQVLLTRFDRLMAKKQYQLPGIGIFLMDI